MVNKKSGKILMIILVCKGLIFLVLEFFIDWLKCNKIIFKEMFNKIFKNVKFLKIFNKNIGDYLIFGGEREF